MMEESCCVCGLLFFSTRCPCAVGAVVVQLLWRATCGCETVVGNERSPSTSCLVASVVFFSTFQSKRALSWKFSSLDRARLPWRRGHTRVFLSGYQVMGHPLSKKKYNGKKLKMQKKTQLLTCIFFHFSFLLLSILRHSKKERARTASSCAAEPLCHRGAQLTRALSTCRTGEKT